MLRVRLRGLVTPVVFVAVEIKNQKQRNGPNTFRIHIPAPQLKLSVQPDTHTTNAFFLEGCFFVVVVGGGGVAAAAAAVRRWLKQNPLCTKARQRLSSDLLLLFTP